MGQKIEKIIGRAIKHHRKKKNMTQSDLAAYMGVQQPVVSKWEHGEVSLDSVAMVKIAYLLGIDLNKIRSKYEKIAALV